MISGLHIPRLSSRDSIFSLCPPRYPNVADYLGNTAADIALSLNNEPIYRRVRDAGLRSGSYSTSKFAPAVPCLTLVVQSYYSTL